MRRRARMRLAQAVGAQFDTSVVAAFEAILATADESYRCGTSEEFDFFGDGGRPDFDLHAAAEVA